MKRTSKEFEYLFTECKQRLRSVQRLTKSSHQELQRQAALRLAAVNQELKRLGEEVVSFDATESWRTAYERVLSSSKTKRYLSVALIRSDNYWRDIPGQASLDFNFRLVEHGYSIQRIFIIDPFFWPPSAKVPAAELTRWIASQHHRGIICHLARLSDLIEESELVRDFGIYGTEAYGEQFVDFEGRTQRYRICFQASGIREAEERWERIHLYATLFDELAHVISP